MEVTLGTERPGRWDVPFDPDMTDQRVSFILKQEPFCRIEETKFPRHIPLKGIIKNDTRLLKLNKGDIVVREGDYGNSAFFIIKGSVSVLIGQSAQAQALLGRQDAKPKNWFQSFSQLWRTSDIAEQRDRVKADVDSNIETDGSVIRREEDGSTRLFVQDVPGLLSQTEHADIQSGEFFGEIAALGRTPRSATIIAAEDEMLLLEIKWQGLRDIRMHTPFIREHIDKLYRERSLKTHLKETKIFAHLNEEQLSQLADLTQFHSFGNFDWNTSYKKLAMQSVSQRLNNEPKIVEEGDYIDGLIMIRAGFVRISEKSGSGHRTISFLGKGQTYGFWEIFSNWKFEENCSFRHTMRCIGHVDVLIVPVKAMEEIVLPSLPKRLRPRQVKSRSESDADLAKREKNPKRLRTDFLEFVVEDRYINGTATMMIDMHRCTRCDDCVRACAAAHDNNPKFVREGNLSGPLMIGHACMQCQDPVCMIGCPTGAIHREKLEGQVVINDSTCIGCATCSESCPYENIQMVEVRNEKSEFILDQNTNRPIVKATKCDLCFEQIGGPACERACPHDALVRADMRDKGKLINWLNR